MNLAARLQRENRKKEDAKINEKIREQKKHEKLTRKQQRKQNGAKNQHAAGRVCRHTHPVPPYWAP
jgi:hypothetical protein